MKNFTRLLSFFAILLMSAVSNPLVGQSVLQPGDPVVDYNKDAPPTEPPFGQIGKWVRTPRLTWNTTAYKAYIYKGIAFRLHYPKTYNPTTADGKKYPMLMFFHGLGELGSIYDNELHLFHGGQLFSNNVQNGTFDGYVLAVQSQGYFGTAHYQYVTEIINYMVANNKLDPFAITSNGLSAGGQATWEMLIDHPTYVAAAIPMSWTSIGYTNASVTDKIKYSRIWVFQGALDGNPAPSTSYQVKDAIIAAGGHIKLTEYANEEHWTWDRAWMEPDFFPFVKRAYSANPYPKFGKAEFLPGEAVSTSLGLPAGFAGYEWRKNGVLIPGATANMLSVTSFGTYDARVNRGGVWSDWSRIPVVVKLKDPYTAIPEKIEAEDWSTMSGVQTENTSDLERGLNVGFIDAGDWMDYGIKVPTTGAYTVKLRLATPNAGSQLQLKKATGEVLATINVPNTAGYQTWRTVYVVVNLTQGDQMFRVASTAGGWNFNWLEFAQGIVNQPPNVDAGPNQAVPLPTPTATTATATLTGVATDADGTPSFYRWSKIFGPDPVTITNSAAAQTTVTGLAQAIFVFRLTVIDNQGGESFDDVQVNVNPYTPPPMGTRIEAENWLAMSGVQTEGTSDAGGGLNVGYIDNTDWMDYNYTAPVAGTYAVRLRVASPLAGGVVQIRKPDGTVLATVSIPNTGGWQNWQTVNTTITLAAGAQVLRLVSSASPNWNINWLELNSTSAASNTPPTVSAGPDKSITLPVSSVVLNGSASDADGTVASLAWTKVTGPASFTFSDASVAAPTVSNLTQGTYTFRLTATDNVGAVSTDDVVVTVNPATPANTPPTVSAGPDKTITLPVSSVVLNGSASDADGTVASLAWTKVTGPASFTFSDATVAAPTVSNLTQGTYTFRLTATDNLGAVSADDVIVTVNPAPPANTPPTVSAGPDKNITLPVSSVVLNGSASDADGTVASLAWTKVTGPASFTFSDASVAAPTVSNLTQGTYTFRLTATDNLGAVSADDVVVTVNPAPPANTPPTVSAGPDKTITLPVSSVVLNGSASDADGTVASLAWTKVTGPASFTFSDATVAAPTVSNLTQGTYTFRLTATDNLGAVSTDDVVVIVNPSAQTTTTFQAYIATTINGNQPFGGELGMEFKVHSTNGIIISQLGAFDHQGNGITGTQSGGIRVAVFNKSTKTIIPGLDVIISGAGDAYTGNHRMKTVNPVTLMPGDYMIVAKGYSETELNGNSGNGAPFAPGELGNGAISYAATTAYGSPAAGFGYPSNPDAGPGNRYLAGTFRYSIGTAGGPPPNTPPTVSAGPDKTITLPVSSVQLNGSASDADGSVASLAWTKVTGPASFTFSNSTVAAPTVSNLTQGTYTFRLTATDNLGAVSTDDVVVIVNPSAQTTTTFQAYIATTINGNQPFGGELGMEFKVHSTNGIIISQLGAFDHQGNGITGTQSGGIRVAVFNKSTKTIIPGLDVIISGAGDAYTGNHRMKTVNPVTLMPGDYMIVAKGYSETELNGNSGNGAPFAPGELGNGAISYAATTAYGSPAAGFGYPLNPDAGPGNRYLAGTFRYSVKTAAPASLTRDKPVDINALTVEPSIGVFPNPVRTEVSLNVINNFTGRMLLQIVGANGSVQKTIALQKTVRGRQQFRVSTVGLLPGKYLVTLFAGDERQSITLIKL